MNRRTALKILAAAPWLSSSLRADEAANAPPRVQMGLVIHSFWVRRDKPLAPEYPPLADPLAFVAAAAGFRDIRNAEWRVLLPTPIKGLTVSIEKARVRVFPD